MISRIPSCGQNVCSTNYSSESRQLSYLTFLLIKTSVYSTPSQLQLLFKLFHCPFLLTLVPVLVSYRCHNKLTQTLWLKTTHICYLTVLQFRSWNGFHEAEFKVLKELPLFPDALDEEPFPFFSSSYPHALVSGLLPPFSKPATAGQVFFFQLPSLWFSSAFLLSF